MECSFFFDRCGHMKHVVCSGIDLLANIAMSLTLFWQECCGQIGLRISQKSFPARPTLWRGELVVNEVCMAVCRHVGGRWENLEERIWRRCWRKEWPAMVRSELCLPALFFLLFVLEKRANKKGTCIPFHIRSLSISTTREDNFSSLIVLCSKKECVVGTTPLKVLKINVLLNFQTISWRYCPNLFPEIQAWASVFENLFQFDKWARMCWIDHFSAFSLLRCWFGSILFFLFVFFSSVVYGSEGIPPVGRVPLSRSAWSRFTSGSLADPAGWFDPSGRP